MSKYAFTLPPSSHAELSASGTSRWMACPASPSRSVGLENKATIYAATGTAAHYIAAECQNSGIKPDRWLGQKASVEGYEIDIDQEMIDAINLYLTNIYASERKGDRCFVEADISAALRQLHPKLGGHADRIMWRESEKLLRVYDFKYGAGVYVEVIDNKQMKTYALGALLSFPQFHADRVEVVIVQPRLGDDAGFRSDTFPAIDLLDFSADLLDAARATEAADPKAVAGDKQCRWCPAARVPGRCPELEQRQAVVMADHFDNLDARSYSVYKLSEALVMLPLLEARIEAIRSFAYGEAEKGVEIPGFKVVEKRAVRRWKSEDEVKSRVLHNPEFYTLPKLKSPHQIEQIVGKKVFAEKMADLTEKVSSGHTLAPADDPRPAVKLLTVDHFENLEQQ